MKSLLAKSLTLTVFLTIFSSLALAAPDVCDLSLPINTCSPTPCFYRYNLDTSYFLATSSMPHSNPITLPYEACMGANGTEMKLSKVPLLNAQELIKRREGSAVLDIDILEPMTRLPGEIKVKYKKWFVAAPPNCYYKSNIVPGETILTTFWSDAPLPPSTCTPIMSRCQSATGTFTTAPSNYETCNEGCTGPDGTALTHGNSKFYYLNNTAANCNDVKENRVCSNGSLSGSHIYPSCGAPANCTGPDGLLIANGASSPYFSAASAADCNAPGIREERTCSNGFLSGTFTINSCSANPTDCTGPDGAIIISGSSKNYYSSASSLDCLSIMQTRNCTNGILSGSFTSPSCSALASCTGPDGDSIAHGSGKFYYSTATSINCDSVKEYRTCTNGSLSGSNINPACSSLASCTGPDGSNIAHGSSKSYYSAASAPDCNSIKEDRNCNNGGLTGSYTNPFCSTISSCTGPDGTTIADGASKLYYSTTTSVNCDAVKENRTCSNGSLSGSFINPVCSALASCTGPDGLNIAHGSSRPYYSAISAVDCNTVRETRTCSNGSLSGSNTNPACNNLANCTGPDGASIAHGASGNYYSASTSSNCASILESRTCSNGSLSGSFTFANCATLANCGGPDGSTIAHGSSKEYFSASSAANCASISQFRSCNNGILSGGNTYPTCSTVTLVCDYNQGIGNANDAVCLPPEGSPLFSSLAECNADRNAFLASAPPGVSCKRRMTSLCVCN